VVDPEGDLMYGRNDVVRGARVYRSAALTLVNNGTTPVAWDAESFDSHLLHDTSTNPERVTLNKIGKWLCVWQVVYDFSSTGVRDATLLLNGSSYTTRSTSATAAGSTYVGGSDLVVATAVTDYVEVSPFQNSGSTRNYGVGSSNTFLSVVYVGT
jgi:hypothetical protein